MTLRESLIRDNVGGLSPQAVVSVEPASSIRDTIATMQKHRVGSVLVQAGRELRGMFTERDVLKRVLYGGADLDGPVESVMTPNPDCVKREDSVAAAIGMMTSGGYRHLPVVDARGAAVGSVSVRQVLHYLVDHFPEAVYNLPPDPSSVSTAREGG